MDVGPGRRLSGFGSPSGQETGRQRGMEQEGSRRPRGWRKNSGKARGHGGGGGGRKPDPARDCPDATCIPRGYRGCAWAPREWAPAVPAVGPKLPSMPGKGLSRVRLRLQMPLCRPWGVAGRGVPARQPHAGTCSLLPQRGRSCNRLCTAVGRGHKLACLCRGQDPRDPPLRWPVRRCCCPRVSWLGSDRGSQSLGGVGVVWGVFMAPWTSRRAQGCSASTVPGLGPPQSLTPTQEGG